MAQYYELPVYKATYDLLLAIFQFTKDCGIIYIYRAEYVNLKCKQKQYDNNHRNANTQYSKNR